MLPRSTASMILSSGISIEFLVDDAVVAAFVMVALLLLLLLLPLPLLLLVLFAVAAVRSVARSSASMSSKSPSVSAVAASASWRLPFMLFFGILCEVLMIHSMYVDMM
jgi:hypothetical protein